MTENEIIRKISYNNDRIGACRADIRNLENQIAQLETLRGKVQNLHSNFSNRQSRRRAKLSNMYSASKRKQGIDFSFFILYICRNKSETTGMKHTKIKT